jgi:choline dehydrogenase-like flavoprotein
MNQNTTNNEYDCLIIGSGTAGATLARELSAQGSRVLMLERGEHRALKETVWGMASILNEIKVAHKLKDPRVFAAGGSSALYLAVAEAPPLEAFRASGIDLAHDYEAVRRELPLMEMPDEMLSPQTLRLRDAAIGQGYHWTKNTMLIDRSRCRDGYDYGSKWKALSYVDEAVKNGAILQCNAIVDRILIKDDEAVGVECRVATSPFRSRIARFYARRIIVSAGSLATPVILRKSGLTEAVSAGYFIDPSIAVIGRVPGLRGTNSFAGTMGTTLDDGTRLLDANLHRFFFTMGMVQTLRLLRIPQYPQHVSIMVKVHDAVGGGMSGDGRYHKEIEPEAHEKLGRGVEVARRILAHAGAKTTYCTPLMTGGAFGTLRLGEDVDANLQTRIRNLHVCDGSLIPHSARVAPTLTLVCLAKYLSRALLDPQTAAAVVPTQERASPEAVTH